MEGFRFVNHTAPIRALLLLLGVVSLVGMPYVVLMPIFADQILHGGARGLGILMGATGVGALLLALAILLVCPCAALAHPIPRDSHDRTIVVELTPDALTRYTHPLTGAYYFVPSIQAIRRFAPADPG